MKTLTFSALGILIFLVLHYMLAPLMLGDVQQLSLDAAQRVPGAATRLAEMQFTKSMFFVLELFVGGGLIAYWSHLLYHKTLRFDNLERVGGLALLCVVVALVSAGCMGSAHTVDVQTNEVAFVVLLNPASADVQIQTVLNGTQEYWSGKQQDIGVSVVRIEQYWFSLSDRPNHGEWRDDRRVITVTTSPVTMRWTAPPIVEGQPMPDMSNAFSLTTLESAGVYTGAELIAQVDAANAALYLASYGVDPIPQPDGSYVARSLASVLEDEVEAFAQSQLSDRYIVRTSDQINTQAATIFDQVGTEMTTVFALKGITITEFGMRDVNVWEDPALQRRFNNTIERQEQLDEANDNATRAFIENSMTLQSAQVQATATMIAARSEADSQRLIGEALAENPAAVEIRALEQWDGRLPVYMDSDTVLPYIPQPFPTAAPTPSAQ